MQTLTKHDLLKISGGDNLVITYRLDGVALSCVSNSFQYRMDYENGIISSWDTYLEKISNVCSKQELASLEAAFESFPLKWELLP